MYIRSIRRGGPLDAEHSALSLRLQMLVLILSCVVDVRPTLQVESNGQGWVSMLVGLLFMYQSLSKILWFRNVNNDILKSLQCGS